MPVTSVHVAEQAFLTFFASLFDAICTELNLAPKMADDEQLASWWREHLEAKRGDFYSSVIRVAKSPASEVCL